MNAATVQEVVETDDVDRLNDPRIHGRCPRCYPPGSLRPLDPYVALCGEARVWRGGKNGRPSPPPPGACEGCLGTTECQRCGYKP